QYDPTDAVDQRLHSLLPHLLLGDWELLPYRALVRGLDSVMIKVHARQKLFRDDGIVNAGYPERAQVIGQPADAEELPVDETTLNWLTSRVPADHAVIVPQVTPCSRKASKLTAVPVRDFKGSLKGDSGPNRPEAGLPSRAFVSQNAAWTRARLLKHAASFSDVHCGWSQLEASLAEILHHNESSCGQHHLQVDGGQADASQAQLRGSPLQQGCEGAVEQALSRTKNDR
uniref:PIPK domain-containing protein n=1 Tax=Macrostomum lignano TaxID=282301 RepID=A0A1I8J667_9PLAT